MAARESRGTNIEPGVIQRVAAGLRYMVTGVGPGDFFGPDQPLLPMAQAQAEGRQFDYPVAFNQRQTPRGEEAVSFAQLRGLADAYDLMRLIIETRKDQIASVAWEIVPEEEEDSAEEYTGQIKAVRAFLKSPDQEHTFNQWLRMQVEEMLVIDAVAVYPRMNRGGGVYGFELVDGATLKRVLDAGGRTPLPPDPAYQQILHGLPAADYSRDQLVYQMRNPRVSRIYGYSPVEQVITTVNIALRRQMSQLAFYTEGNVPEALVQMPEAATMKQVSDFQLWWDSVMEGNLAARRKMRFIPSIKGIEYPKLGVIKDEMDEWLARIVCFAFSVAPSALIKQVNRASGEQIADTAKEEGLLPLLSDIAAHITLLIQRYLGAQNLKFQFKTISKIDPLSQAQVHGIYVDRQVLTPDEVREDLERDALSPADREKAFPTPPPPEGPKPAPKKEATAAEKMLADTLAMLDPSRLAGSLEKAAASQAPRVVEVRPEVNVEVGDTNVHVPAAKPDGSLAKRDESQRELVGAVLQLAAREPLAPIMNFAPPDLVINMPEQTINVAAPSVTVEHPITVQSPPAADVQVDVHMPPHTGSVEEVERDDKGEVIRVTKRPLPPTEG